MSTSIKDRLARAQRSSFVGRARELDSLQRCLDEDGPVLSFVHGIGGIGKSALLDAFEVRLRERQVRAIRLDGHGFEPTARGLLGALGAALGRELASVEAAADALAALPSRVVLIFDHYELLRLLDAWLRRELVPALPASVRVVIAGRSAPVGAWAATPGWRSLMHTLRLEALDEDAARELLVGEGVAPTDVPAIQRFTRGHPLALGLAAAAIAERPQLPLEQIESRHVVEALTRLYLADVRDPLSREALQAASVVRRVTRSLLAAMLGESTADAAFERLGGLGFVEAASDGLAIHRSVRHAIEVSLRASDAARYHRLRCAAWACLRRELQAVGGAHAWRYAADILYLIEYPPIHEAFFPSDDHLYAVEDATADERAAILEITQRYDGPVGVSAIEAWFSRTPSSFRVVRDRDHRVCAYYLLAPAEVLDDALCEADPVAARWREHLEASRVRDPRPVLLSRRMLTADGGEQPSEMRAACWVDVKRVYLENAHARRLYLATAEPDILQPMLGKLQFERVEGLDAPGTTKDGESLCTLMLDFGPDGVFGWLTRLIDARYDSPARCRLDTDARALVVDGTSIRLTRLEYALLSYLADNQNRVIDRDELLREVWEQHHGGSNVVDAAIRALRRKLGRHAASIATIKGFGYEFRGFTAQG